MATSNRIKVMISSRCKDKLRLNGGKSLKDIRKDLKESIEELTIGDDRIFEVWISDDSPPQGGNWNSREVCVRAAAVCDILLVLYNGNAGNVLAGGSIGICHEEMQAGLDSSPSKVRLIDLGIDKKNQNLKKGPHKIFQEYVNKENLFRGGDISSLEDVEKRVMEALQDALVRLTFAGKMANAGDTTESALGWSRMNYENRASAMKESLYAAARNTTGAFEYKDGLFVKIGDAYVLAVMHAIPDAMSISAAKEMVGQPFLKDYLFANIIEEDDRGGPIHIIACHKGATENQAIKLLGFPDATIISGPFGVFVADNIQKVQFVFITQCREETHTILGFQNFFEWLSRTGEDKFIAERALARARIVQSIADEV